MLSHWLKMIGIAAARIPAEMVEYEPVRDVTDSGRIGQPVREHSFATYTEESVSVGVARCRPVPAAGLCVDFHLGVEPNEPCDETLERREQIVAEAPRVGVVLKQLVVRKRCHERWPWLRSSRIVRWVGEVPRLTGRARP